MQLLLKRSQSAGSVGRITFDLWARIELSSEERELLTKYRAHNAILSEGDAQRDLTRAAKYGAGLGLLVAILAYPILGTGPGMSLSLGILAFAVLTYGIYQQIREEIRISDILSGRRFACRSVLALMAKERIVTTMAIEFRHFLEAMKTWGGAEAIDIEPEEKPTVRVLEPRHAAA